MSKLKVRIVSAVILCPIVLAMVYFGGWPFNILLGLVVLGLASEWMRMVGKRPAWMMLGLFYITFSCWALWRLRLDPEWGLLTLLWLLAVVWGADTGGYFFGRLLGGPKLAVRISPNKTWSGFVGGTLTAAAGGWGVVHLFLQDTDRVVGWEIVAFSAAIGVVSQIGDLFESSVKRRFGVKDSGYIIPGHGGLFDRMDGLVAAALVTALITLSGNGNVLIWLS
ncbi:MAG: phosphatidate cytidylyltransferase [Magnetovibrio sp.]|nr:phosphatidate cytidylyltransferase [Magnetovibrio sp.]